MKKKKDGIQGEYKVNQAKEVRFPNQFINDEKMKDTQIS